MRRSTIGQILVRRALPEDMRDRDLDLDKNGLTNLMKELAARDPDEYRDTTFKLQKIGGEIAYRSGGASFGPQHLFQTPGMIQRRAELNKTVQKIIRDPKLSEQEKNDQVVTTLGDFSKKEQALVLQEAKEGKNPLALQVLSGARGSAANLMALLGGDVMYVDASDRPIALPVLRGFSQGLRPAEYWAATYGARKSVIDTKLGVQNAGDLGKQLARAAHRAVVVGLDRDEEDKTLRGLPVDTDDVDNEGALLAAPAGRYARNTVLTGQILSELKNAGIKRLLVRSPAVTQSEEGGVWARDVGLREFGRLPETGSSVGVTAAQALSEPITQMSLGSKHGGGAATGKRARSGFAYLDQLAQVPKVFPGGAAHAEQEGAVGTITEAPAGGWFVEVGDKRHYVPADQRVTVKSGDTVEAGDVLSDGIPNPATITRLKGIGEGRRYFTKAFVEAFRNSNTTASRRNVELVAGRLINHVALDDEVGDFVPGDIVPYSAIESKWKPREGYQTQDPVQAVGRHLERPYLHYSIGTKITPRVAQELTEFGVKSVDTHDLPPPFHPEMIRAESNLAYDPDWMTRFLGVNLKTNLLKNVPLGGTSDRTSTSFVPGIAYGKNFGQEGAVKLEAPSIQTTKVPDFKVPGTVKISAWAEFYKLADEMTDALVQAQATGSERPDGQGMTTGEPPPIGLQVAMGLFPQLPEVLQNLGPLGLAAYGALLSPQDMAMLARGLLPNSLREKLENGQSIAPEAIKQEQAVQQVAQAPAVPLSSTSAIPTPPLSAKDREMIENSIFPQARRNNMWKIKPEQLQRTARELVDELQGPKDLSQAEPFEREFYAKSQPLLSRLQEELQKSQSGQVRFSNRPALQRAVLEAADAVRGQAGYYQRPTADLAWDRLMPGFDEKTVRESQDPNAARVINTYDQLKNWYRNRMPGQPIDPTQVPGLADYLDITSEGQLKADDPALRRALDKMTGGESAFEVGAPAVDPLTEIDKWREERLKELDRESFDKMHGEAIKADQSRNPDALWQGKETLTDMVSGQSSATTNPAARYMALAEIARKRGENSPMQIAARALDDYEKGTQASDRWKSYLRSPFVQNLPGAKEFGENWGKTPAQVRQQQMLEMAKHVYATTGELATKIPEEQLAPVTQKLLQNPKVVQLVHAAGGAPAPMLINNLLRSGLARQAADASLGRNSGYSDIAGQLLTLAKDEAAPVLQQLQQQGMAEARSRLNWEKGRMAGGDSVTTMLNAPARVMASVPGVMEAGETLASMVTTPAAVLQDARHAITGNKMFDWSTSASRAAINDLLGGAYRASDRHTGTRTTWDDPSYLEGWALLGAANRQMSEDPAAYARNLIEEDRNISAYEKMLSGMAPHEQARFVDSLSQDALQSAAVQEMARLERLNRQGYGDARRKALVGDSWRDAMTSFRQKLPTMLDQAGYQFDPKQPMTDQDWDHLGLSMATGQVPSEFKGVLPEQLDAQQLFDGRLGGASQKGWLGKKLQWAYGGLQTALPQLADAAAAPSVLAPAKWAPTNNRFVKSFQNWADSTFPTTPIAQGGVKGLGQAAFTQALGPGQHLVGEGLGAWMKGKAPAGPTPFQPRIIPKPQVKPPAVGAAPGTSKAPSPVPAAQSHLPGA